MGHSGTQFAKYQAAAGDSLGGGFNFWCSTYLMITRFLVRAQVSAIQVSNMQFWGTPLLPRNSSGCSVGFVFAPSESRRPSLSRTLRTKHFPVSDLAHGRSGAQVKSFGLISRQLILWGKFWWCRMFWATNLTSWFWLCCTVVMRRWHFSKWSRFIGNLRISQKHPTGPQMGSSNLFNLKCGAAHLFAPVSLLFRANHGKPQLRVKQPRLMANHYTAWFNERPKKHQKTSISLSSL